MNAEIAGIVDRVLLCGLDLKERLEKGEKLDLAVEQAQLRTLLKSESEARRWPDYGGDSPIGATTIGGQRPQGFLGIRYALVCWLDEIFSVDSPWAAVWAEQTFEYEMYGTRSRAEVFWEQERRAESRPKPDALEGYYLCAMLGFRGKYASSPEKLRAWCDAIEPRITGDFIKGFPPPPARVPPCNVPPLAGRDKLRKLILIGAALAAVLLILTPFVLLNLPK